MNGASAVTPLNGGFRAIRIADGPALLWRVGPGWQMLSSAVTGGGLTKAEWVLNVQVPLDYARCDPADHLAALAKKAGLTGPGVGMLTAAWVDRFTVGRCEGVEVTATTGLSHPVWAADRNWGDGTVLPGTINLVAALPVRLGPAALVNAIITMTEAKSQAMIEAGMPGTGTASDAICVATPTTGDLVDFCGPRSPWGARLAVSCHQAVTSGTLRWAADHPDLDVRHPR